MRIRSNLGTHFAGEGTNLAFYEQDSLYENKPVRVKLAHDPDNMTKDGFDDLCASLSGEVITYNINDRG